MMRGPEIPSACEISKSASAIMCAIHVREGIKTSSVLQIGLKVVMLQLLIERIDAALTSKSRSVKKQCSQPVGSHLSRFECSTFAGHDMQQECIVCRSTLKPVMFISKVSSRSSRHQDWC